MSSDLIDRKIAVQGVKELFSMGECYCDELSIVWMLNGLPSVKPEWKKRKKGKWIVTSEFEDYRYAKCNQCKVTQVFYHNKPLTNFCPNCGTDMRESNKLLNNCSKCKYGKNYLNNMWWCEKHDMMKNREGESCSDFKNR